MSPSNDGRRIISWKGVAPESSDTKRTGLTSLRVDAPAFKPASPPKANPWTNFKPRCYSEPLTSEPSDPPLPSQVKRESNGDDVEEDRGRTVVVKAEPWNRDAPAERAPLMSGPVGSLDWAEEIIEPEPQAGPAGNHCPEETSKRPPPSANPWFTTSNPFSRRAKVKSEPVEAHTSDPPLPPISETESTSDQLEKPAPSSTSKSNVKGSPLKSEVTLVDDEAVSEETLQTVPPLFNDPGSPRENSKNSRPPSRDSTYSLTSADTARRTARSISTGSEDSRKALAAAALQGDEQLWVNHIGADIYIMARGWGMWIHRNVVEHKSLFLKDLLPPPTPVSTRIAVSLDCAPEGLAHCIMYMYVGRLDNIKASPPYDRGHLPRCVLMYSCAVYLRIEGMLLMILNIVEQTANELEEAIRHHQYNRGQGDMLSWIGFTEDHLLDALELIYDQPSQELMKPMRMVMAAVLDNSLLWLLQRPSMKKRIGKDAWAAQIDRFLSDITEYRSLKKASANGSVIPDNQGILELLQHQDLVHKNPLVI